MSESEFIYAKASVEFSPINCAELYLGGVTRRVRSLSVGLSLGQQAPLVTVVLEEDLSEAQEPMQCLLPGLGCVDLTDNHSLKPTRLVHLTPSGTRLHLTGVNRLENTKLIEWVRSLNTHLLSNVQE